MGFIVEAIINFVWVGFMDKLYRGHRFLFWAINATLLVMLIVLLTVIF